MDNGKLASDFNGKVVVSVEGVEQHYSDPSKTFIIKSGENKVVSVGAYIEGDQADALVTSSYKFVPFKFSADDQYVIAGKSKAVEVKALACDDNGGVVDIGYNGVLTSTSSWIVPSSGSKGNVTFAPEFDFGTAESEFVVDESGKIKVSLEDPNFDCTGIEGCPIEGSGMLKGNFMV
ncbi:MSHA biogenesis protein MshQ, partial [Vibrio sp. M60_M31a]